MTQTMTKACHEGRCEHAPFPHKLAVTDAYAIVYDIRTHARKAVDVPGQEFVICLACGHNPHNEAHRAVCACRYNCHNMTEYITDSWR